MFNYTSFRFHLLTVVWTLFVSRNTTCDVLLQLSHAVSVCELQRAGVSALQQARDRQIQARIIGEVERVGEHTARNPHPFTKTLFKGPRQPKIQCNQRYLQVEETRLLIQYNKMNFVVVICYSQKQNIHRFSNE